jgi:hypothetical protein
LILFLVLGQLLFPFFTESSVYAYALSMHSWPVPGATRADHLRDDQQQGGAALLDNQAGDGSYQQKNLHRILILTQEGTPARFFLLSRELVRAELLQAGPGFRLTEPGRCIDTLLPQGVLDTEGVPYRTLPEYVSDLRRFFDRYLKDDDNGWETTPQVRIALFDPGLPVEHSANKQYADAPGYMPVRVVDRPENEWPLARTQYRKLYLDTSTGQLATELPSTEGSVKYLSTSPDGKASFTYQFEEDTELTGYFSLTLWVAAASSNDLDLFVTVDKLDEHGNVLGMMNTGQLRVSHRETDPHRSTRFWLVYKHERQQFLTSGDIVPVEIGIAPSTMFWHAGQQLRLVISGLPPAGPSPFQPLVKNEGDHIIYGGGRYDSHLQVPVIPNMG